ncbi:MAG: malonyl-CoA synthase [Granulosicoccus sp.]|nr:malonyl-CoA synthase [Granulosicoccus sp.]
MTGTNTLYDALTAHRQNLDDDFLIVPGSNADGYTATTWSWGDFVSTAARFAHTLVAAGVAPGDRVAVQATKSPEAFALYLGCLQCGAAFLPMNTAYTVAEILYFLSDAEPSLFICDPARESDFQQALENETHQPAVMTLSADGQGSLPSDAGRRPGQFETVARAADDLAAILYTSGTTGRSKGAMLSHDNLLSNALTLKSYWEFTSNDVLLNALPIYHTHGLFTAGNTLLLSGGKMIFPRRFIASEVIELLPQATTMMGVPTFYTRLLDENGFTSALVQHMRLFISGSAPLLAETHQAFEERTGRRILERYGMTETSMNTSNPYNGERRAGTVGFPLPGVELRIRDADTSELCGVDAIGTIEVRGPNIFGGYWRMPEKTAQEMTADGFFITGDLGKRDADGYIHIVGRGKDLIISGGFNVYPKEIELLLDDQPGVLESAVVGASHPDFGEGVVAYVVADGTQELQESVLKAAVAEKLARFKQPGFIHVIEELPRNTMGKVQKNVLREQAAGSFD